MKDPKIQELDKLMWVKAAELNKIQAAIKALRDLCPHKDHYSNGHSHNDDHYICNDCGHEWSK